MRDYHHFLFYCSHSEANRVFLDADEAHHAATVLRLAKNDPFLASDGNGTVYTCAMESVAKSGLSGIIVDRTVMPRHSGDLRLLVGLPERTAFESLLVDLAALGVRKISPIICKHCQQPWWVRDWEKHKERFSSKMAAGMKQSLYPYLPELDLPMNFELVVPTLSGFSLAANIDGVPIKRALSALPVGTRSLSAIIGPPGGLSFEELARLKETGAVAAKIAETRLTTELASVVMSGLIIGHISETA